MNELMIILTAALFCSSCTIFTQSTPIPTSLNIRAYIDGRSELILQGDVLYWRHLDFDAPGRWEFAEVHYPTYLNESAWQPAWPDIPDATNDFCNCSSSTTVGVPSLTKTDQQVELGIIQGRGSVSIVQQPKEDNDYILIVELNDNDLIGAEWYELTLHYLTRKSDPVTAATSFPPDPTFPAPPTQAQLSGLASISGRILYESSDSSLRVYARNMTSGEVTWVNPAEGSTTYTIPNLEPGVYVVVGWFYPMGASGAYTTLELVIAEGAEQMNACTEAIVRIELAPGETFSGADIGCWGGDFFGLTE
jgi:hypothetical protein